MSNNRPIYRWNGQYFGFLYSDNLFDATSNYLGWVDTGGEVWRRDGEYLGEIVDSNYVLRQTTKMKPMRRMAKMNPMRPMAPMRSMNRMGKMPRLGWVDALNQFS